MPTTVHDSPDLAALRETLLAADRVVMTTHIRPDGDALGSEIAIARWLRGMGKRAFLLNPDPAPRALAWLMDEQQKTLARVYDPGALKHAEQIAEADVLLVVDTNAGHRIGALEQPFQDAARAGREVRLLDHHPDPEGWFSARCVRTDAAAAGEIVYDLIAGHDPDLIDEGIAKALYVAIMTDTGSFRYNATTARTHAIVADLLERGGLAPEPIHVQVFDGKTPESMRLLGRALETITTHYGGRLATMEVTQETLRASGAYFDETEGLVNYALSMDGVLAAVIFLETPNGIKASFRSKGDMPINEWAAKFGGGGHANASGAFVRDRTLRAFKKQVLDSAPPHVTAADADRAEADGDDLSPDDLALLASFKGSVD